MPFCPQCGADYRPGFSKCAYCDVLLVEESPSTPVDGEQTYQAVTEVPLGTFDNRLEAEIVAGRLSMDDIPSVLVPLGPGAGAWVNSSMFPQQLRVRSTDIERARALLASYEESGSEDAQSDPALNGRRKPGALIMAFTLFPVETIFTLLISKVIAWVTDWKRR